VIAAAFTTDIDDDGRERMMYFNICILCFYCSQEPIPDTAEEIPKYEQT
jgi:hypothetical protein